MLRVCQFRHSRPSSRALTPPRHPGIIARASAVTLGTGSEREIRDAVTEAIQIMAPGGGFVLYPVDQIWIDTPWRSIEVMLDQWRKVGNYPIANGHFTIVVEGV